MTPIVLKGIILFVSYFYDGIHTHVSGPKQGIQVRTRDLLRLELAKFVLIDFFSKELDGLPERQAEF